MRAGSNDPTYLMSKSEVIFSVDIEADGPIPGEYSMLSLGACTLDLRHQFYCELQPISNKWVPEALAVSGLERRGDADYPTDAMASFVRWVEAIAGKSKPVFASFSTWDWAFVYYYLIRFNGSSPFGHSSLDMKSLMMGKYQMTWSGTSKGRFSKTHPWLLKDLPPHLHHALGDAKEQAEILNRVLADRVM